LPIYLELKILLITVNVSVQQQHMSPRVSYYVGTFKEAATTMGCISRSSPDLFSNRA